ncbi:hypothetical protein ACFX2I_037106 [Malus domestica]
MSAHHMSGELESLFLLRVLINAVVVQVDSSCRGKIGNLGPQVGIQEDVAGLQVVVDAGRLGEVVEIVDSIRHIVGNLNPLLP